VTTSTKPPALTLADLGDTLAHQDSRHPRDWDGPRRLTGAALIAQCIPDLTLPEQLEIGTERAGNTAQDIAATITDLLDGLALRCVGDDVAQAAICAIRDWHVPDLKGLTRD
jgi:hypothetical protein